MDWLIALAVLIVGGGLMMFALSLMKRPHRTGGGGVFVAIDQVFDPSRRHMLQVREEQALERRDGEPPEPV